jgi:hypothetical protein
MSKFAPTREMITSKSASSSRWRTNIVILLFIAAFNTVCHVSPEYNPFVVHLHEVLTGFTARGQASVELYAPLSTIIGSSLGGRLFLASASHVAWPLVGVILLWMLQAHETVLASNYLTRMARYALLAGIAWFLTSANDGNLLSMVLWFP